MAGAANAPDLSSAPYDPEADAALRYPDWVVGQVHLGWGLHEVLSLRDRVVLLERSDSPEVRRCSLAHAIAHLDLGHAAMPTAFFDARQEAEASALAATRLIALDDLADALRWVTGPSELAAELGVDRDTLSVRWARLDVTELAKLAAYDVARAS